MKRAAFAHDGPERVGDVGAGASNFLHLLVVPAGESPRALAARGRFAGGEVVLLVRVEGEVEEHLLGEEVKTVVVGAHVEPVVPAHAALADVAALADGDLVAADARVAVGDGGGVALAVPEGLGFTPEELHERGREIDVVVKFRILTGGAARPLDDEGNAAGADVGGAVLAVDAELALVFAVIGGDDDGGVVVGAGGLELGDDAADLVVDVADAGIVAVDHAAELVAVGEVAGLAGVTGIVVAIIHGDVARSVRTGELGVAGEHGVGEPLGQGVVLEGIAVVSGHAVGGVRVPVVEVEEPVVLGGVFGEPLVGDGRDVFGGFYPAKAGVVDLVEAGVEPVGGVALAERRNHRSVIAEFLELPGEALLVEDVAETAGRALDLGLGGGAAVANDAGLDAEAAAIHGGAGRQAGGVTGEALPEKHALAGDGVDVGGGVAVVAVATEVVGAAGVDVDVEDAHGKGSDVSERVPKTGGLSWRDGGLRCAGNRRER